MRWVEIVMHVGKVGASRVLIGRQDGKKSLGTPTRRWEDNIKLDLK
jgi:hypothetical protein